jgi:hypothetical protein
VVNTLFFSTRVCVRTGIEMNRVAVFSEVYAHIN